MGDPVAALACAPVARSGVTSSLTSRRVSAVIDADGPVRSCLRRTFRKAVDRFSRRPCAPHRIPLSERPSPADGAGALGAQQRGTEDAVLNEADDDMVR